jgi:chromosomal replication initiator protein
MELLWQKVKSSLSHQIPAHTHRMWIDPLKAEETDSGVCRLICPNLFFRKRINDHFRQLIRAELERVAGQEIELDLIVIPIHDRTDTCAPEPPRQLVLPNMTTQPYYTGRLLHRDFTFDQFVVGKNNDFAYSAALSLAVRKNNQNHSLFLLSKTGMGKSHLSQAIGHQIMSESPNERVYYMTAEDFTNEMVASYKTNTISVFKEKYHKSCDVLLLEDVHYLSGKDRTQIELAHTLDMMFNENKRIIFSSCYSPSEIPRLSDHLRSRLSSGLISGIDPPDYRVRLKIMQKYARGNSWKIPTEVLEYLASELTQDVRQLKSGLASVTTKASLLGIPIDLDLASGVVRNMVHKTQSITIGNIKRLVCKYYNISPKDLVSRSRKQSIVRPRQVAIYLARRYTDQPLQSIGKSFNRYHATALYAIGAVEKGIKQGTPIQRHIEYLSKKLEAGEY